MKAPGVTVQPLINMAEVHSLNEVFGERIDIQGEEISLGGLVFD
jgi:hypothetical protein